MVNDACASRFKSSRLIGPWIEGITRADIDVGSNLVRVGNSIVIDEINQTTICLLSFFLSYFLLLFPELEPRPRTVGQGVQAFEFIGDGLLRATLPGSR